MFYDKEIQILSSPSSAALKTVMGDLQELEKTIAFEELEIEITKRVFTNIDNIITESCYLLIDNKLYKIMKINEYTNDYLELLLYECERR